MIPQEKRKNDSAGERRPLRLTRRSLLTLTVALGCVHLALLAVLAEVWRGVHPALLAAVFCACYLLEITFFSLHRTEREITGWNAEVRELMEWEGSAVLRAAEEPIFITDSYGVLLWYNAAMHTVIGERPDPLGENIATVIGTEHGERVFGGTPFAVGDRLFRAEGFVLSERGNGMYLGMLHDVTELSTLRHRYEAERVAIAYIAIDNVEDILQYVHEKFRDAVSAVDDKIKAWAASVNGVIKSYDNDKYIMLFDSDSLQRCIASRFSILDEIRDTRVGDGISVTVSIGVSTVGQTLSERENSARSAIDMALQRGGDQVVYRTQEGIEYYGGRTKSVYKRSNVRSRTFATQLLSLIARADNVLIMGHKYGDFDSIGASVGVARLAMLCAVKTNIAVDMRDRNLLPCIRMMQQTEDYNQLFVDNAEAIDLITPDTLLILVDHNTLERAQFPDISARISQVAVIDHHRRVDAAPPSVKLSYLEPSASSASELVAEMLESALTSQNLLKEEADLLLAGILLDTKQFTRNTGTRTFGAAQYLRGSGANPADVYALFKTEADDLRKEARFHTAITVYRGSIAISCCDGDTDESYRVIASKAADKMLTLVGIEAAFTLVRIGESIHISGRSNGNVNVQLILERLHGGGHFDVAGAQVVSDSVLSVLKMLKSSIDDYLEA